MHGAQNEHVARDEEAQAAMRSSWTKCGKEL